MCKLLTTAFLGLAATGATLATPAPSRADGPIGIQVQFGRGGFSYYRGHDHYHGSRYRDYDYGYRYRPSYRDYDYDHYHYPRYRRPAIVHPEYYHWTPDRGWHSHGHIHVPHRGHYHTYPY